MYSKMGWTEKDGIRHLKFCSHVIAFSATCKYSTVCAFPDESILSARNTFHSVIQAHKQDH